MALRIWIKQKICYCNKIKQCSCHHDHCTKFSLFPILGTGRAEPIPLTVKAGLSTFIYFFALDWTWMAWLHETSESNPHQRNKKWSVIPSFIDRGGLGRDMLLKRQREVKEALKHETAKKRVKIEEKQRNNFRKHMSGRFAERQTSSDLYKSQKACEQLDKSKVRSCKDVRSSLIYKFLFSCLILG